MRFQPTAIHGVVRIKAEPHDDERGLFARLYCPEEFAAAGLGNFAPVQTNLSRNRRRHTLRGLHFQLAPFAEAKLVRVSQGRIQDVVADLRPESPTYRQWTSVELDAAGLTGLFVPEGCAHGFLTLDDGTDVLYQMGRPQVNGLGRGIRWNDPAWDIAWSAQPVVMNDRDASWPDWSD